MGPQSNPTLAFSCHKSRLMRGQGVKLSMLTAFAVAKRSQQQKFCILFGAFYINDTFANCLRPRGAAKTVRKKQATIAADLSLSPAHFAVLHQSVTGTFYNPQ